LGQFVVVHTGILMSELPSGHDRSVPRSSSPATGRKNSPAVGAARESGSVPRVGVLSLHNSKETKAICNAIGALGCDPVWIREENVTSRIEDGRVRVTPAVDVLLNRLLVTKSERPLEDVQLASLYAESVPVLNHPRAVQRAIHKYRSAVRFAAEGIPVPDAYFARSPRRFEEWTEHLPGRAAHKRTIGTNGREISIAAPGEPVNPRITGEQSFLQEFVDTESDPPFDLRVYVVGDDVVGAMRRHAPEGEWRTNVALGGDVEDVTGELDPIAAEIAVAATDALGLDYSGVDLMPTAGPWIHRASGNSRGDSTIRCPTASPRSTRRRRGTTSSGTRTGSG
jgi:RimK family alpha-L-glutamate ligase